MIFERGVLRFSYSSIWRSKQIYYYTWPAARACRLSAILSKIQEQQKESVNLWFQILVSDEDTKILVFVDGR